MAGTEMLDVPLVIQSDDRSCGQHSVAMIGRFHGFKDLDPFDERITRYQRSDRVLDSFGIALAWLDVCRSNGGGGVFYVTEALETLVNVDGERGMQPADMRERRNKLVVSEEAFLVEHLKYEQDGNAVMLGDGPKRFPDPLDLLTAVVTHFEIPCVIPVNYCVIDDKASGDTLLHNLVVTGVSDGEVLVNNSGPPPCDEKGQRIGHETLREAWGLADHDLIVPLPDPDVAHRFFLWITDYVLNYDQAMYVRHLPEHFFESVVRTCRGRDDVRQVVQDRHDLMLMHGPTAQKIEELLSRLE